MLVIALFGPTGVGKTAVAVALAQLLRARGEDPVAVSADALQVYAGLETLTGAASPAEQALLEHRLLSLVPLDASFSAGQYAQLAHAEIDDLLAAGRRPIVVGGTGLYLRAALAELDLRPPPPEGVRERWQAELERRGPGPLHALLAERAPWAAAEIDPNDRQRIVRALELLDLGELEPPEGPSQLWSRELRHPSLLVGLTMEREALYRAIDERVERMLEQGAREEVLRANAAGASETARRALGFQELLEGDVERMKQRTRNYAKRQLTWMRKLPDVQLIDVGGRTPENVAEEILVHADRRTRAGTEPPAPAAESPARGERPSIHSCGNAIREVAGARQRLSDHRALASSRSRSAPPACAASATPLRRRLGRHPAAVGAGRAPGRGRPAHLQPRRLGGRALGQRGPGGDPVPAPPRLDRRRQLLDRHPRRAGSARRSPGPTRARWTWGRRASRPRDFPGGPPTGAES